QLLPAQSPRFATLVSVMMHLVCVVANPGPPNENSPSAGRGRLCDPRLASHAPNAAARGGRKNNARSTGVGGPAPPELRGCVYLARLNVTSAVPLPADGVRTVYFISSPATVIGRFCSVPFQFGNE